LFIALQTQTYCIRVANVVELGVKKRKICLLRYKRKFIASALQTRTNWGARSGIFVYCVTNANVVHPRCKRGRVGGQEAEDLFIALQTQTYCIRVANADELGGQEAEYLFIALQTQTYCIRVANADELGKRGRVVFLLQQIHLPPALFKIGICIGSTLFGGFSVELSYSSIKVNSIG